MINFNLKIYSQTPEEQRAMWIFNIAYGVVWPNEDSIKVFRIGVFSSKKEFFQIQKLVNGGRNIKGKSVEVIRFREQEDIIPTEILYVTKSENNLLPLIFKEIKEKPVLLFTDRSKYLQISVINFLPVNKGSKRYEINGKNAERMNLKLSLTLLKYGGSEDVLRKLYSETEKKLKKERKHLDETKLQIERQKKLLEEKENLIIGKEKEIEKQRKENKNKQNQLEIKECEILIRNMKIDTMSRESDKQKQKLLDNLKVLYELDEDIKKQKEKHENKKKELYLIDKELKNKSKELGKTKKTVKKQKGTISTQKDVILLFAGLMSIIIFLVIFILIGYFKKRKINKKLKEKNIAINQQKEEIIAQTRQLELINKELEKLSIVASETDNAIIITDNKGNFTWVNDAFTRMFGYTLEDLVTNISKNIIGKNTKPYIKKLIKSCFENKGTIKYEFKAKTGYGNNLWIHATLTPILNDDGEIEKLIIIDTDITKLKKAEFEIIQKSEELIAQREELKFQNNKIEIQNKNIRSSIIYAHNIQKSILPVRSEMDMFFESFIIFRPKDIVSGDFYWFAYLPAKDGECEKIFVAVIDCTGHGVPGAFMSLIANRLLNEIVLENKIVVPSEILETLDIKVKKALRQDKTDNNDGMDLCLCRIDRKDKNNYNVIFSGAKRPLFYFLKNDKKISILKSDRRSIGGISRKRKKNRFTNQEIKVKKDDVLWLSSDGMIDQNNEARKRYGTPAFINLIEKIKKETLQDQKLIIEKEMKEYQGNEEQRDDIAVWGIKII